MSADTKITELAGVVEKIFFSSPKFTTGKLRTREGVLHSFAGKLYVREGEAIKLVGRWSVHPKFGHQFAVEDSSTPQQIDPAGLAHWLEKNANCIGPVRARRIVTELGDEFAEVLRSDHQRFGKVASIPLHVVAELAALWSERESVNAVQTQLAALGLRQFEIAALTSAFGDGAAKFVHDDPYKLLGLIDGFGWVRVDEIAKKCGFGGSHPGRIQAAAITAVKAEYANGSTATSEAAMIDGAAELLDLGDSVPDSAKLILAAASDLIETNQRLRMFDGNSTAGGVRVYALPHAARSETAVLEFLRSGNRENPNVPRELVDKIAAAFSTGLGVKGDVSLNADQLAAFILALSHRVVLISGGAGTGKTTMVRAIYDALSIGCSKPVALCAPTGKAARRMEELIPNSSAYTIHRLLEYGRDPETGHVGFRRNRDCPLDYDAVIVDEVSMLDVSLAAHLIEAIPDKCSVVFVGDHNQLPAVGAGAILRDCLNRKLTPASILSHCHRQAGALKQNCAAILSGEVVQSEKHDSAGPGPWYVFRNMDTPEKILGKVESLFTDSLRRFCFDPIHHVQFQAPMHKGPIGTRAINSLLQRLYQKQLGKDIGPVDPEKPLKMHDGDKVIQTRNNYQLDVMNGSLGVVVDTAAGSGNLIVDFAGHVVIVPSECRGDIELAYCLTPHKMQGSEVQCAVTIMHSSQAFMLNRNWAYTACTRAQKTSIILANEAGIRAACRNIAIDSRRTLLEVLS